MQKPKPKHNRHVLEQAEQIPHSLEGMFQPVIDCLQGQVNFESLKSIAPLLTKVPFFKKSCPPGTELVEFITQSLQHMQIENVPKGQAVFHWGEKGQKFYIVLSGMVGVYVPRPPKDIEKEQQEACIQPLQRNGNSSPSRPNQKITNINQRFLTAVDVLMHLRREYPEKYLTPEGVLKFHQIVTLNAGDCFGDLALTSDTPRAASILALSDLTLLSLTKREYQLIFREQVMSDHKKRLIISQAMSQIGIEKTSGPFCSYFRLQSFRSNEYLYREQDAPLYCYIIIEGTVSLLQQITRVRQNKISSYSEGQIVGMIEVLKDINRRFSLKTEGQVKAYIISHDQFKAAIKQFPYMIPCFESYCLLSERWIQKRLDQFSMLKSTGFLFDQDAHQLKDVFTPNITAYKFETIRSSEAKSPTSQDLVQQKSQKFMKIGGQSTLQLNVLEMYQLKDRFVRKDTQKSTQSSMQLSPQLKRSLVKHLRNQIQAHKRVESFQGLINTFNTTAKNSPLQTASPKQKYFMKNEAAFTFYSGTKAKSKSQGSYLMEAKRPSDKITEFL